MAELKGTLKAQNKMNQVEDEVDADIINYNGEELAVVDEKVFRVIQKNGDSEYDEVGKVVRREPLKIIFYDLETLRETIRTNYKIKSSKTLDENDILDEPVATDSEKALVDQVDTLNKTKKGLDAYYTSQEDFDRVFRNFDFYGGLRQYYQSKKGAQIVTNAWLKCYEIIDDYELTERKREFNVFYNAELPGAFISATNHYCKTHNIDFRWLASSYYPEDVESKGLTVLGDKYNLYSNYRSQWIMDKDMNGDLTNPENILAIKSRVLKKFPRGVDSYFSDAGVDVGKDFEHQEELNALLNYGQVVSGLTVVAPGGSFCTKQYTFATPLNLSIILLLRNMFREFYIIKPRTSRPTNSEIYLLGKGYYGMSPAIQNKLLAIMKELKDYREPWKYGFMANKEKIDDLVDISQRIFIDGQKHLLDIILGLLDTYKDKQEILFKHLKPIHYEKEDYYIDRYRIQQLYQKEKLDTSRYPGDDKSYASSTSYSKQSKQSKEDKRSTREPTPPPFNKKGSRSSSPSLPDLYSSNVKSDLDIPKNMDVPDESVKQVPEEDIVATPFTYKGKRYAYLNDNTVYQNVEDMNEDDFYPDPVGVVIKKEPLIIRFNDGTEVFVSDGKANVNSNVSIPTITYKGKQYIYIEQTGKLYIQVADSNIPREVGKLLSMEPLVVKLYADEDDLSEESQIEVVPFVYKGKRYAYTSDMDIYENVEGGEENDFHPDPVGKVVRTKPLTIQFNGSSTKYLIGLKKKISDKSVDTESTDKSVNSSKLAEKVEEKAEEAKEKADKKEETGDILYYFFNSGDKPPGKGTNESVKNPEIYSELKKYKDWRKVLSNFAETPFKWRGNTYKTAEHAYQGAKISYASPQKGLLFTVESGSELGLGTGSDAQAKRQMVKLTTEQWEKFSHDLPTIWFEIYYAKYSQNPKARRILLLTKDAELWHGAPRVPKTRQTVLEDVRNKLRDMPVPDNTNSNSNKKKAESEESESENNMIPAKNAKNAKNAKKPTKTTAKEPRIKYEYLKKVPEMTEYTTYKKTYGYTEDGVVYRKFRKNFFAKPVGRVISKKPLKVEYFDETDSDSDSSSSE